MVLAKCPSHAEGTMELPRRYLVAIDSYGMYEAALHQANWLAQRTQGSLSFVHAFPERPWLWGKRERMDEWTAGTEASRRQLQAELRQRAAQMPSSLGTPLPIDAEALLLRSGPSARVIDDVARELQAQCLFLGPHRRRQALHFENTLRAVLTQARCPVWIQPTPARPIQRILAAVDFSPSSQTALQWARALSEQLKAELAIAHVFEPPTLGATSMMPMPEPHAVVDELRQRTQQEFEQQYPGAERVFLLGNPAECLEEQSTQRDLLVLGSHGRSALGAAFLGSVTQALAQHAHCGVLVVPNQNI